MAFIFWFEHLSFSKAAFTAFIVELVKSTLLNKSCSNQKIKTTLFFPFWKFQQQWIFWFEHFCVWPLLVIPKGQYLPWANRERPVEHFYGLESTLWRYRKLPCDQHQNLRLLMQNMATLVYNQGSFFSFCDTIATLLFDPLAYIKLIFTSREAAWSCRTVGQIKVTFAVFAIEASFFGDFKCFQPVTTNFINLH